LAATRLKKTKPQFAPGERRIFRQLSSPAKIQDFLGGLKINFEKGGPTFWSPRLVLRHGAAHCLEGAAFAACALSFHGHKPLIMDLQAIHPDESHIVAVFQQRGFWGAIGKTNHVVLRYREPVYKTIRELALSFFHEYFLDSGKKTLRSYSNPVNLSRFDGRGWQTSGYPLWYIDKHLDTVKHYEILRPWQEEQLRQADQIEIAAGKLVEWKK
jgi:hypothetical protein